MKIRGKLLIMQLVILVFIGGLLGGFSVYYSTKAVTEQLEQGINDKVIDNKKYIEERFNRSFAELAGITSHDVIRSMDIDKQKEYLRGELEDLDYLTLAIITPDGTAHYLDDSTLFLGDRDYFIEAMEGNPSMSEIIVSRATNEPVMMLSSPIFNNDEVVGVLIARIDGFYLSDIIEEIQFGDTGYAFILNSEGTFLGHGNRDLVLNEINYINEAKEAKDDKDLKTNAETVSHIVSNERGVFDYTYEGIQRYVAFDTLDNGWKLAVGAYADEAKSGIVSLQKLLFALIIFFILAGGVMSYIFASSISKPIHLITKSGEKIGEGDFTAEIPGNLLKRNDEVGELANTFQIINENMRIMLNQVTTSVREVENAVVNMSNRTEDTIKVVDESSDLIEEVTESSKMQLVAAEESANAMQEMAIGTQRVADIATGVTEASSDIQQRTDLGEDLLNQSVSQMINIQKGTEETSAVMEELKVTSTEITQITQMISDIAEQTNLLSLNASIEAARAGEVGLGFAVVAEEIRKLSEQTGMSITEINQLINDIQKDIDLAVDSAARGNKNVSEGLNIMTTLSDDFQGIFKALDGIHEQMEDLSALAEEMSAGTEEVSASVEEMTATTTTSTENIAIVNEKTQDQIRIADEIQQATKALQETADQLKVSVEQFNV